ncbi:DNA methyltransferase [Flavobacterium palustre]|uniref:site-specific DNA-methyltransferase (adenine-specific) n=1 Tax=Flavobacterium palustre TaxID=1476463 RepID=A0ABQ1HNN5_9FLAO|nr:DNA adenine methylase [Flavobacterium palustre]GGA84535.1 DNA methyltransferase [Flavobacterium palustre]
MFYSPLRYPGGKNKLASFVAKICVDNKIHGHYVEPYAGGASVAMFLLIEGYVKNVTINDKDRSVYAFWHSVLNETDKLCELISNAEMTIDNWRKQKEIQKNKEDVDLLSLGFSTLYLNRTNRSGIIKAGVIGGLEQKGNYKMDCRFNKEEIISRIKLIASYSNNITLCNLDAIELIDNVESLNNPNTIFYFDPPYYLKAESLYMNHYNDLNHILVSDRIKNIENSTWIVSYDDHEFIEKLYKDFNMKRYSFNHSAFESREGKELLFFSDNLVMPLEENFIPTGFKLKKSKGKKEIIYK